MQSMQPALPSGRPRGSPCEGGVAGSVGLAVCTGLYLKAVDKLLLCETSVGV